MISEELKVLTFEGRGRGKKSRLNKASYYKRHSRRRRREKMKNRNWRTRKSKI